MCIALTGLMSCSVDNDSIWYFYNEPAKVVELTETEVELRSPHGNFIFNNLTADQKAKLSKGDIVWTGFELDPDNQLENKKYPANRLVFIPVDTSKLLLPSTVAEFEECKKDDYSSLISVAGLYPDYLDNILFFGFTAFEADKSKNFEYEIILNPELEQEIPTFYIRAKEIQKDKNNEKNDEIIYGFDMNEFVEQFKKDNPGKDTIKINLKYKKKEEEGEGEDYKDGYEAFRSNPISWKISLD